MKQIRVPISKMIRHLPAVFLLVIFLLIGWHIHRDYGLHWDSWSQYQIGKINYQYIFQGDSHLLTYKDRYYGPFFELLLLFLTGSLPVREMFFAQHFITYCSFILGLCSFYALVFRITQKSFLAISGMVFLFISPRIFADSFYNTKDIPFMSAFILAVLTLNILYTNLNWPSLFFHSVTTAMMITIRLQGVLIFALTFLVLIKIFYFENDRRDNRRKIIFLFAVYLLISFALLVLFFPVLWQNPIRELFFGLQQLSRFPWTGGAVFYRGSYLDATALPWHYVPNWILITTPIIITGFFITGLTYLLIQLLKNPEKSIQEYFWVLVAFFWFTAPYLSVLFLRSVLYDGWRHLFFIYPAYVLIAVFGFNYIFKQIIEVNTNRFQRIFLFGIILLGLAEPILFIIQNHPFEFVYFNRIGGRDYQKIKDQYEMDYWGLSYYDALKDLARLDERPEIPIKLDNTPGKLNLMMLPKEDAERFIDKGVLEKSDYFLTNYRWHPKEYDMEIFHSIKVRNARINSIYLTNRQNP